VQTWSETELGFRRERYAALKAEWEAVRSVSPEELDAQVDPPRLLIRPSIEAFIAGSKTLTELHQEMTKFSIDFPWMAFSDTAGMMFFNQVVNDSNLQEAEAEALFRRILATPADLASAQRSIDELAAFVAELRKNGSSAAIARAPFFLSWFWWVLSDKWHPIWPRAEKGARKIGWLLKEEEGQGDRFGSYWVLSNELSQDAVEVATILSWMGKVDTRFGTDPTLVARCAVSSTLPSMPTDGDLAGWEESQRNIFIGLAELKRISAQCNDIVENLTAYSTTVDTPGPYWDIRTKFLRTSNRMSWHLQGPPEASPSVRLTVDTKTITLSLCLFSNRNRKGYVAQVRSRLAERLPEGVEILRYKVGEKDSSLEIQESDALWTDLGVRLDPALLTSASGLDQELQRALTILAPLLPVFFPGGEEPIPVDPLRLSPADNATTKADLLGRFRETTGYPDNPKFQSSIAAGPRFLDALRRENLPALTKPELRKIYASSYGSPGPQSTLNRTVGSADDSEWAEILKVIDYLLWDNSDPLAIRIGRLLDPDDLGVKGLKETVIMKLLAIAHPGPDTSLIFPYAGDRGKAAILKQLELPIPSLNLTTAERHIEANRTLNSFADQYLPNDPYGKMCFLYWMMIKEPGPLDAPSPEQQLSEVAALLYVEPSFVNEIYGLLQKTRQVIFFGPPGTGKTLFAQRIAEVIAPDEEQRLLVQFHPSTSYEDFVEGYRPQQRDDGQIGYELQPGPLRRLALAAADDPEHIYVLVIDEINRANLPKVLGELLFLLEYRNESVRPLYRPDEAFSLPENLWIIGTMNTADRSIALVDAALRRRFQFIEFVPDPENKNPISNVLRNWVEQNQQLAILPEIVDSVNNRLSKELGGSHLALGPSYFMKDGIDEKMLREIWKYQITPLIDDLFFGEPTQQAKFAFDGIWDELNVLGSGEDLLENE